MSKVVFNKDELHRIGDEWRRFFKGELDKPMVSMGSTFSHFDDPKFRLAKPQIPMYPPEVSAEEIVDIADAGLGCRAFVGDSYPSFCLNFGPGSLAAYLGARQEATDSVWFFPTAERLADIPEQVDEECYWHRRLHDVLDAAKVKWASTAVQVRGSDLGNNLDVLAPLRDSNALAFDLVDEPGLVKQKLRAITKAWKQCYQNEHDKISSFADYTVGGMCALSKGRSACLQSDYGYMISPAMFEEFVMPDIVELADYLDDPCYHLDGIPQLQHLPFILGVEKIRAVEFVQGAGQKPSCEWTHVYRQIQDAGKQCLCFISARGALDLKRAMGGTLRGFALFIAEYMPTDDARELYRKLVS